MADRSGRFYAFRDIGHIGGNIHAEEDMRVQKIQKTFYTIVNTVIRVLLFLIVSGLLVQSMFSTSFIGVVMSEEGIPMERTRNIADDPWRHLAVFIVFTVLGMVACRICQRAGRRRAGRTPACSVRILRLLTLFVLAVWTLWIMVTQLEPGSDPAKVYEIAMQWREGNFSAYAEGGYLFRYPYQAGIILFYYLLSFVFGVDNYIGLQFVNVIALAAVYLLLSKLAAFFWKKEEKLPVLVYGALILWMPLAFYVTYLYGILPGLALSLGAVYGVAKYLDTGKYRYVLPAVLCMGLATVIKMNCLIFLIAAACFLVYDAVAALLSCRGECADFLNAPEEQFRQACRQCALMEKESGFSALQKAAGGQKAKPCMTWRKAVTRALASLSVIVLMSLGVAVCNETVNRYVERLSGYEAGEGLEMLSWVVMGLQETPLGPGGYSGYIGDIYVKYDYDAEKVKEASWTDIKKALTRMAKNPLDEGVTFFARKNAFQWNDPSFISLDRTKGRNSAIDMPDFAVSLIEGRGSVRFYVVMNYAQTLLLFGMLLYVVLNRRSRNPYELMLAVVFLGGYLFHFFWESSASYTIPYFAVMIPYAVKGFADWLRYVDGLPAYMAESRRGTAGKKELVRKLGAPVGGAAAAAVFVILLSSTNLFYKTFALDDGEEARAQFYQEEEKASAGISDGYYALAPFASQDMSVVESNGEVTLASEMTEPSENASSIFVHNVSGRKRKLSGSLAVAGVSLRFRSNEQVLAVERDGETARLTVYMDDGMNMFYEEQENIAYLWNLYGTPEQGYLIVQDGLALTYRDGAVTLEELTEGEEQRWIFR